MNTIKTAAELQAGEAFKYVHPMDGRIWGAKMTIIKVVPQNDKSVVKLYTGRGMQILAADAPVALV